MSRTYKDKPYAVRQLDFAKKHGNIDHRNHKNLGKTYKKKIYGEVKFFTKSEPIQRYDYEESLNSEGISYVEEKRKMHRIVSLVNGREEVTYVDPQTCTYDDDFPWKYAKEIVVIAVVSYVEEMNDSFTDNCTDAHDLKVAVTDSGRNYYIDVNTGKKAVCVPGYSKRRGHKGFRQLPKYGRGSAVESRTNVNRSAWEAIKVFRAGELNEEFDDIHLGAQVHVPRGCRCCG